MNRVVVLVSVLTLVLAACGGVQEPSDIPTSDDSPVESGSGGNQSTTDSDAQGKGGTAQTPKPEPSGPVEMNTIRIGDQVWSRTLPMTTGQCFVYEDDGTLPTSGTVWGTLNGDEDLRFSASFRQDGTFEAEISNDVDMYWLAGERAPDPQDLTIELNFQTLTIEGSGTFFLINTGEYASGSFAFQCEEE